MFANHHDVMIVLIWWLANYFPLGGPGLILRWRPVQGIAMVLLQLSRASTMAFVMSLTAKHHPKASIGIVIMGVPLHQNLTSHDTVKCFIKTKKSPNSTVSSSFHHTERVMGKKISPLYVELVNH
jgi:hypothetical protein